MAQKARKWVLTMARLINPNEAKEIAKAIVPNPFAIMAVNAVLDHTPSVDAVEVVRCKDCVFSEPSDASDAYVECRQLFGMAIPKDWYCADGERRTE